MRFFWFPCIHNHSSKITVLLQLKAAHTHKSCKSTQLNATRITQRKSHLKSKQLAEFNAVCINQRPNYRKLLEQAYPRPKTSLFFFVNKFLPEDNISSTLQHQIGIFKPSGNSRLRIKREDLEHRRFFLHPGQVSFPPPSAVSSSSSMLLSWPLALSFKV